MTKYTKTQRRQIALAFRDAKSRLWDGKSTCFDKEQWICHAIGFGVSGDLARGVVEARLGDAAFLTQWLEWQGVVFDRRDAARIQAHRHAWLDLLIKEFEA